MAVGLEPGYHQTTATYGGVKYGVGRLHAKFHPTGQRIPSPCRAKNLKIVAHIMPLGRNLEKASEICTCRTLCYKQKLYWYHTAKMHKSLDTLA